MSFYGTARRAVLAGSAAALLATGAQAASVTASLAYDTLNLDNHSWLVPGSVSVTDPSHAQADTSLMPNDQFGGGGFWTYMDMQASADAPTSDLHAYTSLRAGGRSDAVASWSDSFANTGSGSQHFAMNIALSGIELAAGGWTNDDTTRDLRAGVLAEVFVNGASVWHGGQVLSVNHAGGQVAKLGADIGTGSLTSMDWPSSGQFTSASFNYTLDGFNGSVDLGEFAAGQSFDVKYVVSSFSYWNDPAGCSYECASASAAISDPFGVNGAPRVSAVPEPTTIALFLAGLLFVGGVSRRMRRD